MVFTQYQYGEQTSIPPDILRNAMANCYKGQERFQLGLMDDAAECFVSKQIIHCLNLLYLTNHCLHVLIHQYPWHVHC